jgi:DnaJ-class molecular chaperone
MRRCDACHGTGKWELPEYQNCSKDDPAAIIVGDRIFKMIGFNELQCPKCEGTGYISCHSMKNMFIGD